MKSNYPFLNFADFPKHISTITDECPGELLNPAFLNVRIITKIASVNILSSRWIKQFFERYKLRNPGGGGGGEGRLGENTRVVY